MRKLKSKICCACGKEYQPSGSCSKYCSDACYLVGSYDLRKKNQWAYRERQGRQVGIGSGGTTGFGKDNHMYKHGRGVHGRLRFKIKQERRYCAHCQKDLLYTTHYQWVVHHKDHDKFNNPEDESNWVLLCKRCHQIEHQCWKAFEGATTISEESRGQESSKCQTPTLSIIEGDDIV